MLFDTSGRDVGGFDKLHHQYLALLNDVWKKTYTGLRIGSGLAGAVVEAMYALIWQNTSFPPHSMILHA